MKITKSYDENVNLGNYQTARVGLVIECTKEISTAEELEEVSGKLLILAKKVVRQELREIKEEREQENESK